MMNKSFYNPAVQPRVTSPVLSLIISAVALATLLAMNPLLAFAGDAPAWMHAVVSAPLPAHDEKTDAVLLYSETNVSVISADKVKTVERRVYKILRPDGRDYGDVAVPYSAPWQ